MIRGIVRFELYKIWIVRMGWLAILICLAAKCALLIFIPEQKDMRILYSRHPYDQYLDILEGPVSPEKEAFLLSENARFKDVIDSRLAMEKKYYDGELSEPEWTEFYQSLDEAYIKEDALSIFVEANERFTEMERQGESDPPWFIYEYGWETVFAYNRFPDLFLLLTVVLLSASLIPSEITFNSMDLLRSTRNGQIKLFDAKLSALMAILLPLVIIHGGLDLLVFSRRFDLSRFTAPIYSIPFFAKLPIPISLGSGYSIVLLCRALGAILFGLIAVGLSIYLRTAVSTAGATLLIVTMPLFARDMLSNFIAFTPTGVAVGTDALRSYALIPQPFAWILPLIGFLALTGVILGMARKRFA